ncbi:MAG: AbrB/MazE/SpoVT family DNA-binding domain-containing protein [Thermodesulfobacteriota bacterium]
MPIVKTLAKGQVVIPAALRKKIGLRPGSKVLLTVVGDKKLTLEVVPDDPIEALRGIFREGTSLTEELLIERQKDTQHEEQKFARFICHPRVDAERKGRSHR